MIRNTEPSITLAQIPQLLVSNILECKHIAVFFDQALVYRVVNEAACLQLNKTADELLNKCILDLYPGMIASNNHRNLLKALEGETIQNFVLPSSSGAMFYCYYEPIYESNHVIGVLSKAKETAFQGKEN